MLEEIQCDVLVVGSGVAAVAAGRRLLDFGRSIVCVELWSERPVRGRVVIDPTPLTMRALSGPELDDLLFHTPTRHSVRRLFPDDPRVEVSRGEFRCRDSVAVATARQLLVAPAPGDVEIPDVPDVRELMGYGLSTCAWSDTTLFAGPVVVVGDGDWAYESAILAAMFRRDVVLLGADVSRVKRASLRSRLEADSRIRVVSGTNLVSVRSRPAERFQVEFARGADFDAVEAGGVVFAGDLRYGAEVRQLVEGLDRNVLGDAVVFAGGLTGVDEDDHEALVRDGFRAADALLGGARG